MAKVAKAAVPPSTDANRPLLKRKTPSQLRGEQLKRRIPVELVHDPSSLENTRIVDSRTLKPEGLRNTRFIEKRLDEVFQARKPISMLDLLSKKTSFQESQESKGRVMLKSSFSLNMTLKSHQDLSSKNGGAANIKDNISDQFQIPEKENQNKFRSVAELSLGVDKSREQDSVDVDKAFRGLAAREKSGSCSPPSSAGQSGDVKSISLGKFCSELVIPGRKVPLDFTLKSTIRIVSLSPVDRVHRLLMSGSFNGMTPFSVQSGNVVNSSNTSTLKPLAAIEPCSLHSWIYPQSSLPASVISVLSSSTGEAEMDFVGKRQIAWEDSFRNLYYMLRKSECNVFYVCTSQFVVLFTAVDGTGKGKRTCNAYISQSTRGLRSLLREQDVSYSMPFCCSEVEQISREDLVELLEIEKQNLGQAKRMSSSPDVDSTKSLLALIGNESVHGLYDFLLNYRSFLTTLSSMDVPVLCAPFPFVNAALSSPEVKCKEIKRPAASQSKEPATKDSQSIDGSKGCVSYSIELKGGYLPPWIVSTVCSVMCSEGKSFEASFTTEPNSMGLNAALDVGKQSDIDETKGDSQEDDYTFGIPATVITSDMRMACLKGLRYSDESQVASLTPL